MNETGKTVGFLAAAAVALGVGIWSHWGPAEEKGAGQKLVNENLFADFQAESARSLEIVEYDADTGTPKEFKVAQEKGIWRIPSHEDYPADASQQLGEAAAALAACKIVNIESDEPASHVTYGVVDPEKVEAGATGVGKRVTMEDKSNNKLAQVIIGKSIKGQGDLHYVRVPGRDTVYVVSLKTDKFSTKFEDWIEKDLLKLNAWDIETVSFNEYSVIDLGTQIGLDFRNKIRVNYDSKDSKWKLEELEVWDRENREYQPESMADDEELNSQKLNELKTALDDLKIVDVRRKPEGLAADLRLGEGLQIDREAMMSLTAAGYRVLPLSEGAPPEVLSSEGEIHCGTKEGVEYVLRFGRIAGAGEKEAKSDEGDESEESAEGDKPDGKQTGANRFVMVTAHFNEELLTKPELTPLPGESPANESETEGKDDAEKTSAIESSLKDAAGQVAQVDDADAGDDVGVVDDLSAQQKRATSKPGKKAGDSADQATKDAAEESGDKKPEIAKPKTKEELELERITKENERKQKDYDDKVKKGEEKVKELSSRFADWYYVVSDSTYQKIHLGRDEIVKKKTPAADDKKADTHDHEEEGDENVLKREPLPE